VEERLGHEVTDQEFQAMYERIIKPGVDASFKSVKDRLAIDAHHTHTTSEPKETP
jgi:hypothetical protein